MAKQIHKQVALLGLGAIFLSGGTIICLAAWRTDGYSHLTKAVSELGSQGAPHGTWFN